MRLAVCGLPPSAAAAAASPLNAKLEVVFTRLNPANKFTRGRTVELVVVVLVVEVVVTVVAAGRAGGGD